MLLSQWFALALFLLLQTAPAPVLNEGILDAKEKMQLARATNVEQRIKVYDAATIRFGKTLHTMAAESDFAKLCDTLRTWNSLLAGSLQDVEANLRAKKKSRALIHYEIQVRKILTESLEYKNSIPEDQEAAFKSNLAEAEKIRKRFVEIIFKQ